MIPQPAPRPASLRYVACEAVFDGLAEVRWKDVDEGWIRYDPAASQTLLLAPITRFVLDLLTAPGHRLDADAIVAAVRRAEPDAAPEDCRKLVDFAVEALLGAQLIRPEPHS